MAWPELMPPGHAAADAPFMPFTALKIQPVQPAGWPSPGRGTANEAAQPGTRPRTGRAHRVRSAPTLFPEADLRANLAEAVLASSAVPPARTSGRPWRRCSMPSSKALAADRSPCSTRLCGSSRDSDSMVTAVEDWS